MSSVECEVVQEHLEELALGELAEPARTRLLAHVSECADCRGRLDAMSALADSLLTLAPQHEPPPGFESRVLDRWSAAAHAPQRHTSWWLAVAAAVLLVAVGAGAFALGRRRDEPSSAAAASGVVVRSDGSRLGAVTLVNGDHPYALVTIDHPSPNGTTVDCRLVLADGTKVTVGSWGYADVVSGVWAVGVDAGLLAAVRMEVVDADGNVVATATLV